MHFCHTDNYDMLLALYQCGYLSITTIPETDEHLVYLYLEI